MEDKSTIQEHISKIKYFGIFPSFKEKSTQKFTAVVLTLIALSFFGFFAISPTLATIAKLNKEIEDNEFVYQQLEKKIIDLNSLKTQYANLENDLPAVLDALPTEANIPLLIAQIQSIAQSANIQIKKIQQFEVELFGLNKEKKKFYSFTFSISGKGDNESISQFTQRLSNMQRVINVDTLGINKSSIAKTESLEFSVRGIAFFKE